LTLANAEPSKKEKIATGRNRERVERADTIDQELLSKYLPATANDFLPTTIPGPDDSFIPPAWLMTAIKDVLRSSSPVPKAPPVHFDLSDDAVRKNTELLHSCNLDMDTLLSRFQDTTLGFGSKFRPIEQMEKVLGQHPNFEFFSEVLANGMSYHFKTELSEDKRKVELEAIMTQGNHQSVQEDSQEVAKLLAKDVQHGFLLLSLSRRCPRHRQGYGTTCQSSEAVLASRGWIQNLKMASDPRPLFPVDVASVETQSPSVWPPPVQTTES
jgi:hypothetical protein